MELVAVGAACYAAGVLSHWLWVRRRRRPKQQDRDTGLRRYQEHKGGG